MTDSFENRIILHLNRCVGARTTWNNLKYSLENEMGITVDPKLLHYKLEKLKAENKIKFVQVGDFISYSLISSRSSPS
jgi:hypothetical protein